MREGKSNWAAAVAAAAAFSCLSKQSASDITFSAKRNILHYCLHLPQAPVRFNFDDSQANSRMAAATQAIKQQQQQQQKNTVHAFHSQLTCLSIKKATTTAVVVVTNNADWTVNRNRNRREGTEAMREREKEWSRRTSQLLIRAPSFSLSLSNFTSLSSPEHATFIIIEWQTESFFLSVSYFFPRPAAAATAALTALGLGIINVQCTNVCSSSK